MRGAWLCALLAWLCACDEGMLDGRRDAGDRRAPDAGAGGSSPDAASSDVADAASDEPVPQDARADAIMATDGSPEGSAPSDGGMQRDCEPPLLDAGVHALDERGVSDWVELALPAATSRLQISIEPADTAAQSSCYGLEALEVDGQAWVGPGPDAPQDVCGDCTQLVRSHPDAAFFSLPSSGEVSGFSSVRLRASVRDCETGLRPSSVFPLEGPSAVRVRHASYSTRETTTGLSLDVVPVLASSAIQAAATAPGFLETMRAEADRAFAQARIELRWHAPIAIAAHAPVVFEPSERSAVDALMAAAREALGDRLATAVPVVLSPCLERHTAAGIARPLGLAPHLPGTCHLAGHGVLVATESCAGGGLSVASAQALGVVVAHELGHYLGLFHVDEPPQTDLLPDTEVGVANLMHATPTSSITLTPAQVAVLRRHPQLR